MSEHAPPVDLPQATDNLEVRPSEGMQEQSDERLIVIRDCKEAVLSQREWKATADYALFHFTQSRTLRNPELFSDCTFPDLFINHKTQWGAPIPGTFQVFFEDIVRTLLPPGHKLVLNVTDLYEGYFEPNELVERVLKPNNLFYLFLEKENGEKHLSLFFECPIELLKTVTEQAFSSSLIDIDGFVMANPNGELFQRSVNDGNTDVMFRELVRAVHLAFAVWGDHNGLFIVTDKLDMSELRSLIDSSDIEKQIRQYLSSEGQTLFRRMIQRQKKVNPFVQLRQNCPNEKGTTASLATFARGSALASYTCQYEAMRIQ